MKRIRRTDVATEIKTTGRSAEANAPLLAVDTVVTIQINDYDDQEGQEDVDEEGRNPLVSGYPVNGDFVTVNQR
jgi:hypothetical protein